MKRLLSLVILTGGLAPGVGASAHVLDVSPGALGSFLRSEKIESGSLVLRGTIDARDISALGTATLDTLDLSGITIASYVAARPLFFGARSFAANALPVGAFAGSQIRTVILPVALRSIPDNAFTASSVTEVHLPEGILSIGESAFAQCPALERINFPASLTQMGEYAFAGSSMLAKADLSATGIAELPAHAFDGCTALNELSLPRTVRHIGELAIAGTGVENISATSSVETAPFALAKATELKSSAVTLAEPNATGVYFGDSSLSSVASPSPVIADAIYAYCTALNTTDVLAEATQVGSYAFAGTGSWRITFSETVTSLGDGVFADAIALESIDVRPLGVNIPSVTERTFDGLQQSEITLLVTPEYILDWANAPGWRDFKVVGAKGIDDIADNAYSVTYSGGQVTVRSGETLLRVTVYGTDGRIVASAAPDACETSLKLDTPDNVLVVTSRTAEGKTYTDKLFIR